MSLFPALIILWAFGAQGSFAGDTFAKDSLIYDDKVPWNISADSMAYDEKDGAYTAEGNVVITKGHESLYAQKATYNTKTGIAHVSGNVRLESAGNIITGDKGFFDLEKKTGKINSGSLFLTENHYYIRGDVMEKLSEDSYLIKNCLLTTCDGPNPDWTMQGSEVKVTIEGYGKIRNASFRVRDLPFVYVPYLIFPAKTKRQSGLLLPRVGYSSRNGIDVEVPFFWAISGQTDATFYQRFLSKRGYMQGMEFRYAKNKNSSGAFLFDILPDSHEKDMNDKDDLKLGPYDRTNDTRYWLRGKADKDLTNGLVARMDMDFVSDQDYLKEFKQGLFGFQARPDLEEEWGRPVEEKRSPARRSGLRLSHDSEDHSLQALFEYHQQQGDPADEDPDQPVMSLNFISLPKQLKNFPVFFGLGSEYGFIWRDDENENSGEKLGKSGHRFSLSPELKFPFWLFDYLECDHSLRYLSNPR
ncbi:MAG: LPS assembly protein LptD [Desulfobacterales bacterium]|nr:LPS assembly protein LptD [Desulfobacterales bacterium]